MNPQEVKELFKIVQGLGMEFTEHPKPGDYHVVGNGAVLRASPNYTSKTIATLQNGEGIHVFGDVETDPEYMIHPDDSVTVNDGSRAGIDYVRIGTQTHGAGWVAMPYIEPGAAPAPKPQEQPKPVPTPAATPGMSALAKLLLGTVVGVGIVGGTLLVVKAVKDSGRRPAYT